MAEINEFIANSGIEFQWKGLIQRILQHFLVKTIAKVMDTLFTISQRSIQNLTTDTIEEVNWSGERGDLKI